MKCYQLIGVPGSGKSTWFNDQDWVENCAYISTDKFVEEYAQSVGKTYNEVFKSYMPTAVNLMVEEVKKARNKGQDIVWDQTSVSVKSRKRKFKLLPDYEHIAVVFKTPDEAELARRLGNRPGKNIPKHIMDSMIENLEIPTLEEGFKEIWYSA